MSEREVIIGVTGGVAAYKTAALVSKLVQNGTGVAVVMTEAAAHFIGAATFAALTGQPVATQIFDPAYPLGAHIMLAERAQLLCIAPASADFMAKAAHGLADDLLSTLYLAYRGPVLMAPAMNSAMWEHASVQRNVGQLVTDGVTMLGPEAGWLSCRQVGSGRMISPEAIYDAITRRISSLPK